jgi:hypothetical protein
MQFVAVQWKHPSVLLLIEIAPWYSKKKSSGKLSFLNANGCL